MNAPALKSSVEVADLRRTLIANGYSPVPVVTGDKMPKVQGWAAIEPDASQVDALIQRHPDHLSTGLLTGTLVAIDVDVMDEPVVREIEALIAALPGAVHSLSRVGKAPKILYLFRTEEPQKKIATPEYIIAGKKAQVEVMGQGQQIVALGAHPETGKDYEWIGDSPLDVPFDDLPLISRDVVQQFLADAEAVLGKHGVPKKAPLSARATPPTQGGETPWRRINSLALESIEKWVVALFPFAKKEAGTGSWRVTSSDLGRSYQEGISVNPDGIRDFGEEVGLTPLDLVQKWGSASSIKEAAFWLCERLGVDPSEIGLHVYQSASTRHALVAANDNEPEESSQPPVVTSGSGMPVELCYPPGAVGEFAKWIVSCSRFPSPHLSLAASLAFTAAIVGRRYKGPTGLRSNLYVVGLAESGFGKDITIRATAALADSTAKGAEVSKTIFMDEVRSVPGLASALRRSPSSVTVIDEFGKFLGQHTGPRVAAHREEIATAIMALTGAPAGYWGGQEKGAGNIPRIVQPCFSIHGVSTPSTFWAALSSGNISEGLLGRLVLIEADGGEPKKVRKPTGSLEEVPPELSAQVHALLGGGSGKFYGGPFYALDAKSDEAPWPVMKVEFDEGVEDIFEDFDDAMRARKKEVSPEYRPILNRVGENAARLALIVAVGVDYKNPVITAEIQNWANAVAEHSLATMLRGADANIADNEKSAEYLRVRQIIARKGEEGITLKTISRTIRGAMDGRRIDDILSALRQGHEVHLAKNRTASGQVMTRFWLAEHLPAGSEIVPIG